jgi:hypothetical protein
MRKGFEMLENVMKTHRMILQSIRAIKSFPALFTSIATFTSMNQSMLVENRPSQEALVANCASERENKKVFVNIE